MQKEVRLIAPLHNRSGYAKAGRGILAALLAQGYVVEAIEAEAHVVTDYRTDGGACVRRIPLHDAPMHPAQREEVQSALRIRVSPDAPTLIMGTPDSFTSYPEHPHRRIGLTMWETDRLTAKWARRVGSMDRVIVPSRWNAEAREGGADVIPLCVDERCWQAEGEGYAVKNRPEFLFVSAFAVSERKNWREMMAAFAEEFWGESVGLLIRASGQNEAVIDLAKQYQKMGVWMECIERELSEEEMGRLYREADCFVLPSVEGFGMPYAEAALCGTPSIALDGQAGWETARQCRGIWAAAALEPCLSHLPHLYPSSHRVLKPVLSALRRVLRGVARSRLPAPAPCFLSAFSRESVGSQIAKVLEEVAEMENATLKPKEVPQGVVIMLTCNHLLQTKLAIQSLRETAPECGLLVVDDGSTDGTQEWLRANGVTFIESPTRNIAQNWNLGVEYLLSNSLLYFDEIGVDIRDCAVVFCDNDIEFLHGWYEPLWAVMESADNIGIVAPTKMLPDGGVQNCGCWLKADCVSADNHILRPVIETDYVETACMMVRPELWKVMRMDARFPIFYNDTDYCYQARMAGFRVAATSESRVVHYAHTTSNERAGEADALRQAFIVKHKEALRA